MVKKTVAYVPSSNYKGTNQPGTSLINADLSVYSLNAEQIGLQAGANDSTVTIYTVPKETTLFVTTINLQVIKYDATASVNGRGKLILAGQTIMRVYSPYTEGESMLQSINFSIPYILKSGESVQVVSESAHGLSQAGFSGFLVKNQDLRY